MKKFILIAVFALTVFASQSQTLIAHYPFDGNANDTVGGNNGVFNGTSSLPYVAGHIGQAIELNGISDYISMPDNVLITPQVYTQFTVTAWIKLAQHVSPQNWPIISFGFEGQSSNDYVTMGISYNGQIKAGHINWNIFWENSIASGYYPEFDFQNYIGTWIPVAFVFYGPGTSPVWDQKRIRFYSNGKSLLENWDAVFNATYGSSAGIDMAFSDSMSIGFGRLNSPSVSPFQFFKGAIDDVRIYSGLLDTTQLNVVFNTSTGLNESAESIQASIYPNPTSELININSATKFKLVEVLNITGQLVRSEGFKSTQEAKINVSDLEPGIYLVRVTSTAGATTQQKMIIN